MTERTLCVVGLGLIGGSLLRAADAAGWKVRGCTRSASTAAQVAQAGFDVTTSIEELLAPAAGTEALVVLAVPLPAVAGVLQAVARHAPRCRLSDVVSVKQPVAAAVARHAPHARYVGGHPMAGGSTSGWAAGSPQLFRAATWVVGSDDGTDPQVWAQVTRLALDCGAHVVPASAADHDAAVARISHLPHVLAAVLASVGAGGGPLALALGAGSFRDGTRVAGSAPELVRAMCEGNRQALLEALDDALGRLGAARGSLASTGALEATISAGHQARRAFEAAHDGTTRSTRRVNLSTTGAFAHLRQLGQAGGRVVALHGTHCEIAL